MGDRIRVTEGELKARWFSAEAHGMIHDHQTGEKVVVMDDGTEYATPFTELASNQTPGDDAGQQEGTTQP